MNDNQLNGALPNEIGLPRLQELLLYNNQFMGTLPEGLYNSTNLLFLRLDMNNFDGTISNSVGALSNLIDLRVNNNTLTGTIPVLVRIHNCTKFGHLTYGKVIPP
jgi:Leucine-rich repeat (LRR) protein